MRIIDRYILKSVVTTFLACMITFLFLYVIIDVFANLDDILKQKVGLETLLQYYAAFLPIIFVQVTPISCLLATLYTFGKLNRDNEIIALRSSGLSIFQITKTVIIFGLITSVFVFWVNDRFVPRSIGLTEKIKLRMSKTQQKTQGKQFDVVTNLSMYGLRNRLFFINSFYSATSTMEGIIILEHDERQNITKKIVANKGVYSNGLWTFYHCITYDLDSSGQIKNEPRYFEEEIMPIPEKPNDFLTQRQRPDLMNISEIQNYIWRLSRSGATAIINNLKVDLYQRFTMPLASLIMIILAIPFSLMIRKRATGLSSLGLSIMVGFLYYGINAVSIALGKKAILSPLLSASLSHIITFLFSLYLIYTVP